jgi:hypothetical protein
MVHSRDADGSTATVSRGGDAANRSTGTAGWSTGIAMPRTLPESPVDALEHTLDFMCDTVEAFLGTYEVQSASQRRRGGQVRYRAAPCRVSMGVVLTS